MSQPAIDNEAENAVASHQPDEVAVEEAPAQVPAVHVPPRSSLILPSPEARRERATNKSLEREASRIRLQELKQNKARESKHFVNCPLDYDTKKRLERAASENDLKMTVIVKAAIDQFLKDNGY
ncbi:hypothetical protein [Agrobacterium vitis]|uniref:hypothetical protein n=1 Tax=Agrobacterium vitis TaxID=373 RepID=UPI001F3FEDFB|nr:hypothetical protein [Agrobacterium vitis]